MTFMEKKIAELVRGRENELEQAVAAGDLKKVDRITGEINALKINGKPVNPDELECGEAYFVKDFLVTPSAKDYLRKARETILNGEYVPEFFFAGAATRLGLGPMYFLDPRDVAKVVTDKSATAGLGQRQLAAYASRLAALSEGSGIKPEKALK